MIGFYTKFTTEASNRDALANILQQAASAMLEIEECKAYIVGKDAQDAEALWVTEIWTTASAHANALALEGAKQLIAQALPLLTQKPEQIRLDALSGKGL